MATGNASLNFAIKAINEASKTLREVSDDIDKTGATTEKSNVHLGKLGGHLLDIGKIAGGFVLGTAFTSFPNFLMDAARAAAEDEATVVKLTKAVENTGAPYAQYQKSLEAVIKRGQELAFTDEQTRTSLALLVAQTGSVTEAQRRYALAQDLSRGTTLDLETASRLLGKVTDDNVKVLGRYGIVVEKGTTETELFGLIQQKFGGQAEAFAKSTAGQWAIAQDKFAELQETIGAKLIPIMTLLIDHSTLVLGVIGSIATMIGVSMIPKLVLLITTTWAYVSALSAQAVAFAMANPYMAAAVIAAGLATAAIVKLTVATQNSTRAESDLGSHTDELRRKMLDFIPVVQKIGGVLDDLSFSALAAKIAEATVTAGMDDATVASGSLVDALKERFEHETKVKDVLDKLTESYTHNKAKADALTSSNQALADAEQHAATQAAFYLKIQTEMTDAYNRALEKEISLREQRIDTMRREAVDLFKQLTQGGQTSVSSAQGLLAAANAAAYGNAKGALLADFQAGKYDLGGVNAAIAALGPPPGAAQGAIVKSTPGGTLVTVGEGGHDEAIVPLDGRGMSHTFIFNGPIFGMLDLQKKIVEAVRDAARGGAFRGVPGFSN